MRNGYSLVPCREPRYLSTRSRRVEVWPWTRWSSTMTQSETYSSIPLRVSDPSPRSPVMMAVTPRSLSQANSRRSSARRIEVFSKAPNSVSMVSSTTRLAPTASIAAPIRMNRPVEVPGPGLLQVAGGDLHVVHHQQLVVLQLLEVEAQGGHVLHQLVDRLLEGDEDAGLVELRDAAHQELHRQQGLAAAGRPADQRRAAEGQPALGDLVEAADAGGRLGERAPSLRWRRGHGRRSEGGGTDGHKVTSSRPRGVWRAATCRRR